MASPACSRYSGLAAISSVEIDAMADVRAVMVLLPCCRDGTGGGAGHGVRAPAGLARTYRNLSPVSIRPGQSAPSHSGSESVPQPAAGAPSAWGAGDDAVHREAHLEPAPTRRIVDRRHEPRPVVAREPVSRDQVVGEALLREAADRRPGRVGVPGRPDLRRLPGGEWFAARRRDRAAAVRRSTLDRARPASRRG